MTRPSPLPSSTSPTCVNGRGGSGGAGSVSHAPIRTTPSGERRTLSAAGPFVCRELELRVRHRMQRKTALEGAPYEVVIHEAALRIMVCDRAASRTQLAGILEVSEADRVTVRIIPLALEGLAGAASAMMHAGGAAPKLDTVVRDAPNGAVYIDSEAQLSALRTLFRKLEAASLDPDKSRDLINRVAKEM